MTTDNLWGDLTNLETVNPPRQILQDQAGLLTRQTRGRLRGEVRDRTNGSSFGYSLDIVAPTLNDYRYAVLTAEHGIEMYPVRVTGSGEYFTCANEEGFIGALSNILQSTSTRKAIAALLSQISAGPT
jgi:hypothetical protein